MNADRNRRSEARNRMLTQAGHLYAAYSKEQCWIKLGFSLDVDRRLREINSRFPVLAPFSLIGSTPSVYEAERQMHRILAPFRHYAVGLSRELYLALPKVEELIKTVVGGRDRPPMTLEEVRLAARWSVAHACQPGMRDHVRSIYTLAHRTGYREMPA